MNFDDQPTVAIGTNKLGGRSHYTKERFLWMLVNAFVVHNRVVLTANVKTEWLARRLILMLGKLTKDFVHVDQEGSFSKPVNGREQLIFYWVVDKKPLLRNR